MNRDVRIDQIGHASVAIGHFDGTGDLYDAENAEVHTAITSAQE